jgi:ABC-2 type transport system ATP-binding protein
MAAAAVPAIFTSQLTKQYAGGVRALANVDLSVPRGAVFGLLGPNGAGKSTLIRILLDMIRPTAGYARILEWDTQRAGVEARRHIGYLQGSPRFYAKMTADDLFDFVARVRGIDVDRAYVESLVARLDLATDRQIRTLSRGNQQKVGLIVALLGRPEVVILDEPTTGLDPLMQEQVLELVREAAREGRTVFFSSHILHEVEHLCDQVAVLRGGELVGVFDLAAERRLAARLVTVTFDAPVPAEAFAGLPGVSVLQTDGPKVAFTVTDGVAALIKRLADFTVTEIESHEPTLEDFFFSLYRPDEGAPDVEASSAPTPARGG